MNSANKDITSKISHLLAEPRMTRAQSRDREIDQFLGFSPSNAKIAKPGMQLGQSSSNLL